MKSSKLLPRRLKPLLCLALLFLLLSPAARSVAPGKEASEKELRERIHNVEAEIQKLLEDEKGPAEFIQYRKLQKEMRELNLKHNHRAGELQKRINELSQSPEARDWNRVIGEKRNELRRLRRELEGVLQARGRELHEMRRAELAKIASAETPKARALGFSALTYPRVDGSTSAQPLGVVIACKTLGVPYKWAGTQRYSGPWSEADDDAISPEDVSPWRIHEAPSFIPGGFAGPNFRNFSLIGYRPVAVPGAPENVKDSRLSVIINKMLTNHSGTHGSYVNVIEGRCDVALAARRPSQDEIKLMKEKGVVLDVRPFALDAFVFIANRENPVESLTAQQIRDIYSGKITSWKEVGGPDRRINAYQRNENSGSQELMESLVMKDRPMTELKGGRARKLIQLGMGGPYIALTNDEDGLAYSVYYYEHFMAASPNTKLMAVEGVKPSFETIQSHKYPYASEVYAVTRKGLPENSGAVRLRDWLLSDEGQAVVRESGYVPLKKARLTGKR